MGRQSRGDEVNGRTSARALQPKHLFQEFEMGSIDRPASIMYTQYLEISHLSTQWISVQVQSEWYWEDGKGKAP